MQPGYWQEFSSLPKAGDGWLFLTFIMSDPVCLIMESGGVTPLSYRK
ncbi:hypothetical protein SAMN05428952_101739 [Nitrosomonas sp. Nm132]|jgi:hypothetical protein|nr:hypothetical protein SAMN05428952_101739 [Nitrosomonas sp. Nm132]SDY59393.1 hypothetical protein SAMN05421754_101432 [Nitrosomonas sp. Nm58]